MTLRASQIRFTIGEYLRRERESLDKHEYRNGEILLMAGGSADHSLIVANVIGELRELLKGKPCRAYESNLRIRIPRTVRYTYPDAAVICGQRQIDPDDPSGETVTNPRLIVEVLSPTTEAHDRGGKFEHYREIESFEEYVLVSQTTARIETFWRQSDGTWLFMPTSGLNATAKLRCLDIELPLKEVYEGVKLPSAPAPKDEA